MIYLKITFFVLTNLKSDSSVSLGIGGASGVLTGAKDDVDGESVKAGFGSKVRLPLLSLFGDNEAIESDTLLWTRLRLK